MLNSMGKPHGNLLYILYIRYRQRFYAQGIVCCYVFIWLVLGLEYQTLKYHRKVKALMVFKKIIKLVMAFKI